MKRIFDNINIYTIKFSYFLGYIKAKILCAECGRNARISSKVSFYQPSKINIKENVEIRENSLLDARTEDNVGIIIKSNCRIKENIALICYSGCIDIDENVLISRNTVIYGHGGVFIGKKAMIGPNCVLVASNHFFSLNVIPFQDQGFTKERIIIGNNVWIGASTTILAGSTIEDNVVIAAGSVVTGKKLVSGYLYAGIPAKQIRELKIEELADKKVYYKNWDEFKIVKENG